MSKTLYTGWQNVDANAGSWHDCYGREYSTADLFSFRGFHVPVAMIVDDGSVEISWKENSMWSDFPETHVSILLAGV